MDYLMNTYFFPFFPITFSDNTRINIVNKAISIVQYFDWLCKAQDFTKFFNNHTSFFAAEVLYFFLCLLTFIHACRKGNRYFFTWFGILILAINVEYLKYWVFNFDNDWKAQGFLTLFGMRAPLSLFIGTYHVFYYISYVLTQRMHLVWWAEGPAVGLGVIMLSMPYQILGTKFLWWTYYESYANNNINSIYQIPWFNYYFNASIPCYFVWIVRFLRKNLLTDYYYWKKFCREYFCVILAAMSAFWCAIFQFIIIYYPLNNILKINYELITFIFVLFFATIVFIADRRNLDKKANFNTFYWFDELALAICVQFMFYIMLIFVINPQNIISEGLHQPIGPCDVTENVQIFSKQLLKKKKYLCLKNYDKRFFNFDCLPNRKPQLLENKEPLEWYTICGTVFENRLEYSFLITSICIIFSLILYQAAAKSGKTPIFLPANNKNSLTKTNAVDALKPQSRKKTLISKKTD